MSPLKHVDFSFLPKASLSRRSSEFFRKSSSLYRGKSSEFFQVFMLIKRKESIYRGGGQLGNFVSSTAFFLLFKISYTFVLFTFLHIFHLCLHISFIFLPYFFIFPPGFLINFFREMSDRMPFLGR